MPRLALALLTLAAVVGKISSAELPHLSHQSPSSSSTPLDPALTYATFRSPPIPLRSGQIANTQNNWGPLEFLTFPIGIRHFDGKIVDDSGRFVPLTEVYVHHWIIFRTDPTRTIVYPNGGVCSNLVNMFGIGAELYHTEYDYAAPYAVTTTGEEVWSANMHLIRTTNVPDVQSCIECHCPYSNPPANPQGGIACCPDQAQCWGMANSTLQDTKNYYLQYTVGYVNLTKDVVPLTIYTFDVTATHTFDCNLEFQVPAQAPGEQYVMQSFSDIPTNLSVVFLEGHVHVGGVDFTVEHYRGEQNLGMMCHVIPVYGTSNTPGNETGYIVDLPPCTYSTPYELLAGDRIRITATYDSRSIPGGHAWHEGVMGLIFLAAVAPPVTPEEKCEQMIHVMCGIPPYASAAFCLNCANATADILRKFDCTDSMIRKECNKTAGGGGIPVPPAVTGVELHIIYQGQMLQFFNLTGPAGNWFAMGIATNSSIMQGTPAFVYTLDDQGVPALQLRVLGNHAPGTLVKAHYPANITNLGGGVVQILFNPSSADAEVRAAIAATTGPRPDGMSMAYDVYSRMRAEGIIQSSLKVESNVRSHSNSDGRVSEGIEGGQGYVCYLFARGSSMTFDYHGAARGTSCFPTV